METQLVVFLVSPAVHDGFIVLPAVHDHAWRLGQACVHSAFQTGPAQVTSTPMVDSVFELEMALKTSSDIKLSSMPTPSWMQMTKQKMKQLKNAHQKEQSGP